MSKRYISKQVKSLTKMKKELFFFFFARIWLSVGIYPNAGFTSDTSPVK